MRTKSIIIITLSIIISTLSSCKKSVLNDFIPTVEIDGDPAVSSSEVNFSAKVSNPNDFKIVEYGFEWGNENTMIGSNINQTSNFTDNSFSYSLDYALVPDEEYNVRAFIKTPTQVIYSNPKYFYPKSSLPPTITDFYPKTGKEGDIVTIEGDNFFSLNYQGAPTLNLPTKVYFGSYRGFITFATKNRIDVVVAPKGSYQTVSIRLNIANTEITVGDFTYEDN